MKPFVAARPESGPWTKHQLELWRRYRQLAFASHKALVASGRFSKMADAAFKRFYASIKAR